MTDLSVSVAPSVTTGPIAGSSKVYRDVDDVPGAKVPFRRVHLSTGEHFDLYDTSGPYTDPDAVIDLHRGLPPRPGVVRDRGTQLQRAGPERSPRRWPTLPCGKACPPNWCATRWLAGGR
ncbi:thiC-associated domain protein [Mycobacterium xenopi 4042]|uniref:ThiC-associated domain protein n=1 Tax=Mycobacterium xenopi 4042 TaxID=1299334 RepID=X8DJD5_MYCXE|nr:thiC-associated domain protein [Mycobacterium xenopi 4042]